MPATLPRGDPTGSDAIFRVHERDAALFSRTIRLYAHRPTSMDPYIQVPVNSSSGPGCELYVYKVNFFRQIYYHIH